MSRSPGLLPTRDRTTFGSTFSLKKRRGHVEAGAREAQDRRSARRAVHPRDLPLDRFERAVQPRDVIDDRRRVLGQKRTPLLLRGVALSKQLRVAEQLLDRHARFAHARHELHPLEMFGRVPAIAARLPVNLRHETDAFVVSQRVLRESRRSGGAPDGEAIFGHPEIVQSGVHSTSTSGPSDRFRISGHAAIRRSELRPVDLETERTRNREREAPPYGQFGCELEVVSRPGLASYEAGAGWTSWFFLGEEADVGSDGEPSVLAPNRTPPLNSNFWRFVRFNVR
jgi:hypothetical protein